MEETVKFCPSCGTSVVGYISEGRIVEQRRPVNFFGLFLIVIILAVVLYGFISLLPIRHFDVDENRYAPLQNGLQEVVVDLSIDVGNVNVFFNDLVANDAVTLSLSITGYGSLLSNQPYTFTFDQERNGTVLIVTSEIETSILHDWLNLNFLETECNIIINPSLNVSITVRAGTGRITFETKNGLVLNSVRLETATGIIEASFVEGTIITRDISIMTVTGTQSITWLNIVAERDITVEIGSVTGAVSVDIKQDDRLHFNIELGVEVTTGAINLTLDISGDLSGKIVSSTTTGSVDTKRSNGFRGSSTQLQSNNYPSNNQFDIALQTTTGGVNIDANYSP